MYIFLVFNVYCLHVDEYMRIFYLWGISLHYAANLTFIFYLKIMYTLLNKHLYKYIGNAFNICVFN
jgi:hypothetical protein